MGLAHIKDSVKFTCHHKPQGADGDRFDVGQSYYAVPLINGFTIEDKRGFEVDFNMPDFYRYFGQFKKTRALKCIKKPTMVDGSKSPFTLGKIYETTPGDNPNAFYVLDDLGVKCNFIQGDTANNFIEVFDKRKLRTCPTCLTISSQTGELCTNCGHTFKEKEVFDANTDSVWTCPVCTKIRPIEQTICAECGNGTVRTPGGYQPVTSELDDNNPPTEDSASPLIPDAGLTIAEMCDKHHVWLEAMGWNNATALEDLAMLCSEFGEAVDELPDYHPDKARFADLLPVFARAVNAARGDKLGPNFGIELADIVLRAAGIAKENGVDLQQCIRNKMAKNLANGNPKERKK